MGLTSPEKTPDLQFFITLLNFVAKLVEIMINKAVVGSSCRDTPKYTGEGVASSGTTGTLGVPLPQCSCLSMVILGNFVVGIRSASSYLPMLRLYRVL